MKTLELNLPTPVLLVWGLPEDAELIGRMDDRYYSYMSRSEGKGWNKFELDSSNWQLIGKLSELTEGDCKGMVKFVGLPWCAFKDYTTDKNWFSTALESFHSAIEAEGYYMENPLDYLLQSTEENFYNEKCDSTEVDIVQGRWQESQSKTLPTNTLVFKRI